MCYYDEVSNEEQFALLESVPFKSLQSLNEMEFRMYLLFVWWATQ